MDFDEQRFEAVFSEIVGASRPAEEDGNPGNVASLPPPLWGKQTPASLYAYRGQGLSGRLTLRPRPPRLRARCNSTVVLASGHAAVEISLALQAEAGTTRDFDVWVSTPIPKGWEWKTASKNNSVTSFQRIPVLEVGTCLQALAAVTPLGRAALLAVRPAGEFHRLTLARPLSAREPLILQAACRLPRIAGKGGWEVPLVALPAASRMDGEVVLHLAGADLVQVEAQGLRDVPSVEPRGRSAIPCAHPAYTLFPVSLALRGQASEIDRASEAVIDHSWLTSAAYPDGRLVHCLRFRLWNWRQPTLPVRLPLGAQLLEARVDNAWLDQVPPAGDVEDAVQVELPVPVRPGRSTTPSVFFFEIAYTTNGPAWGLWGRLQAAPPQLPINPIVFSHSWRSRPAWCRS